MSFGKERTSVPLYLVSQLMLRYDCVDKLLPPKMLRAGDEVMLAKGPFKDFLATIETTAPDRRVYVLLVVMGTQTRVAASAEHVRAV